MREEMSGTCETVLQGLKSYGITPDMLKVAMELGNPEAIEMAVERGVGIAFVSEMIAARGIAMGRVKRVELQGLGLHRTAYLIRHLDHPFTHKGQITVSGICAITAGAVKHRDMG